MGGGESFVSYPLRRRPLCRLAASEILLEKIQKEAVRKVKSEKLKDKSWANDYFNPGATHSACETFSF
jgi:hypothetical protein